jgi:uncharacterized repeat protein (TIGR01451 family)
MSLRSFSGSVTFRVVMATLVCVTLAGSSALAQDKGVWKATKATDTPYTTITSAGPLPSIFLGDELSAQIEHTGDSYYEVYPGSTIPADYGTFLVIGGTLYAPDFSGHGGTATGSIGTYTAHSPVSQTGVTGSGTNADPYRVVTVANVGTTGLSVTQTDSYVVGTEYYRTDMVFNNSNPTGVPISAILYRAMDCYLGGSDSGFGFVTGSSVGCSANANNSPPGRVEQLVPITPGSSYYEAGYSQVWEAIGAHAAFDNTCRCTEDIDNGVGVSWNISVPAGGSATVSHFTVFSPTGIVAIAAAKTADQPLSQPGATNGYTITFNNPDSAPVTLNTITDTLSAGFTYLAGTTTGATTSDPAISSQQLTWTGPFNIPATGSLQLHFQVQVPATPGLYYNQAGGEAADNAVAPTGPTAPIQVGPAESGAIPTLGTLGLLGFALLLAIAGVLAILRLRP